MQFRDPRAEEALKEARLARDVGVPQVLALVSKRTQQKLTYPCGACLQVALELGGPDLLVVVSDTRGHTAEALLGELAPQMPSKVMPLRGRR